MIIVIKKWRRNRVMEVDSFPASYFHRLYLHWLADRFRKITWHPSLLLILRFQDSSALAADSARRAFQSSTTALVNRTHASIIPHSARFLHI